MSGTAKRTTLPRRRPKRMAPPSRRRPTPKARAKPKHKPSLRRSLAVAVKWGLTVVIWTALVGGVTVAALSWDLPDIARLGATSRQPGVRVLAADGSRIASYGEVYGAALTLRELPSHLAQAVLAIEDRRFYDHIGIDLIALARAGWVNLRAGGVRQGGSTLTQQIAKNLFLGADRTIKRKIQEAILALVLESRFTKDELLTIYLNRVYMGAGTFGVDAAAHRYFGKSAREVSLHEAAVLAGLLRAPSRLNPAHDAAAANARAAVVLNAMVDAGFLSAADAAQPGVPLRRDARTAAPNQRYFTDWVRKRVAGYVGGADADLQVQTTLDPKLQAAAEQAVAEIIADGFTGQVALVALRHDGAVVAMIGGRAYGNSQFNRATQALRQPGSAFKPIVYLAAAEAGWDADSRVVDAPVEVEDWRPANDGNRYHGEVTLREALARSLNSVAVRLTESVGRGDVIAMARRLGISAEMAPHPSIALGAAELSLLELTAAYGVLANGGIGVAPYGVRAIRERGGETIYEGAGFELGQVVQRRHAATVDDMLRAVVAWGTGTAAQLAAPAAGKTGTSQGNRDAWFIGYADDLVAGVWLGNDDGSPMDGVTGGGAPARIWRRFMELSGAARQP